MTACSNEVFPPSQRFRILLRPFPEITWSAKSLLARQVIEEEFYRHGYEEVEGLKAGK